MIVPAPVTGLAWIVTVEPGVKISPAVGLVMDTMGVPEPPPPVLVGVGVGEGLVGVGVGEGLVGVGVGVGDPLLPLQGAMLMAPPPQFSTSNEPVPPVAPSAMVTASR